MVSTIIRSALMGIILFVLSCSTSSSFKKNHTEFRDYSNAAPHVKQFYKDQHRNQTFEFAKNQLDQVIYTLSLVKDAEEAELTRLEQAGLIRRLSIWDSVKELDKLIDESDPDFSLPNSLHALQAAEAIRRDIPTIAKKMGVAPLELDWFILVGLLHDLGKLDALFRRVPQWAVVGDSFPVGLKFSEKNILYESFKDNPDNKDARFNTELGIYPPHIGLDKVVMSYGHDEYAYRVFAQHGVLPKQGLSMIRFHSFYPLHRENAYLDLLLPQDVEQLAWVREFSPYDLYSKHEEALVLDDLKPFYIQLINKYFPPASGESELKIAWPVLKPVG